MTARPGVARVDLSREYAPEKSALESKQWRRGRHLGRVLSQELLRKMPQLRLFACRAFGFVQRMGFNITPNHFYWPIPDFKQLEQLDWQALSQTIGIEHRFDAQLQLVQPLLQTFWAELEFPERPTDVAYEYHRNNGFFETVDAEVAYCMVRHYRPRRIIEVGGGNSTRLLAAALRRNAAEGMRGDLITIEPNPDPVLRAGFPGLTELIIKPVQEIPVDYFAALSADDILFLDSSHVVSVGSDVVYQFLEVLPRVHPGVIVHIHDVFTPAHYPRKFVLQNLCFWAEQYLLQSFLCFNKEFEVLWSSSAMQFTHRERLQEAIPRWQGSYSRIPKKLKMITPTLDECNVWPCSFWMRRKLPSSQTSCETEERPNRSS